MIRLENVSKSYWSRGVRKCVADRVSFVVPSRGAVALIGRNGTGKSSLLQLMSGQMQPDAGRVRTNGLVSWPVGFAGSFHGEMTGAQNARFVARIYGIESDRFVAMVASLAEIGAPFHQPFRTYSTGMKARLAFAVSMSVDFDTLLIDEVTSVGDAAFRARSEDLLVERLRTRAAVIVSHNLPLLQRLCQSAVVLENGRARIFDDVGAAIAHHRETVMAA